MQPGEGNGKIYLGIPRERLYFTEFVDNRDKVLTSLHEAGLSCGYYQASGHRVDRNRDMIVKQFLSKEEQPEWLLMLDSDMEHVVDIGQRLARFKQPIVGGLYFHRNQWHDPFAFRNVDEPEIDEWGRPQRVWAPLRDEAYDFLIDTGIPKLDHAVGIKRDDALMKVDAVATGAILIHRSVLETMQGPWFEYITGGISEDIAFCIRATEEYDFPIYCDFSTISGHFTVLATGYAEFMDVFESRGVHHTSYSKADAVDMLVDFYNKPREEMQRWMDFGDEASFSEYWRGLRKIDGEPEVEIYEAPEAGTAYIKELIYWNATPEFNQVRKWFIPIRGKNVIEIGSGIGTLALQLAIQRNNVTAVEVNPVLREFMKFREARIKKNIETKIGEIRYLGSDWMEPSVSHASYDAAFSIDVFEHMELHVLKRTIWFLSGIIKPKGKLYYHANWKQQDIFPMHHDYSDIFETILSDAGFYSVSPFEAIRM